MPWYVVWRTLREPGTEEWLVKTVQSLHRNAQSFLTVKVTLSDDLLIQVDNIRAYCLLVCYLS